MAAHKRCTCCGQMKQLTDFHRRTASRDGLQPVCKPCNFSTSHAVRLWARAKWAEIARQNAEAATAAGIMRVAARSIRPAP